MKSNAPKKADQIVSFEYGGIFETLLIEEPVAKKSGLRPMEIEAKTNGTGSKSANKTKALPDKKTGLIKFYLFLILNLNLNDYILF
jgi:hypothetical protein